AASLAPMQTGPRAPAQISAPNDLNEATVAELQAAMAAGLPSTALVRFYLERIAALDQRGPKVNSIIEINQHARAIAPRRDAAGNATTPTPPTVTPAARAPARAPRLRRTSPPSPSAPRPMAASCVRRTPTAWSASSPRSGW